MCKILSRSGLILVILSLLSAASRADSIPEIAAKARPAIVEIVSSDPTGKPKSLGAGFFISPDGLVVTNQHVIEGAGAITAVNNNGAIFLLERVLTQPPEVDLVILKFHATDVPFLTLGKSTTAVEGQKVIVIGNPTGLMGTVSDGIISSFREDRSMIQITAPISHGSSGSPVMDENGQVIGVATLQSAEGQNLNFAIPVEKVSAALAKPLSEQVGGSALPIPTPAQARAGKPAFDSGIALLRKGEYNKAISAFTDAIRLDPNNADAYFYRGFAYAHKGNYDNAILDYNDAIRLDPNYAAAYSERGMAYSHQRKYDEAIRDYTAAIRLNPNYAAGYFSRGVAYHQQRKFDEAIRDYTEAIRLNPNYARAYYGRGLAYCDQRKFNEAIRDHTEAIRLNPNDATAYFGRGGDYYEQRKYDEAIREYTAAIRLDPKYAAAYFSRGGAYYFQSKYDEAIRDCTEVIRLDPNNAVAYDLRGSAYASRGELDKAKADSTTADRLKAGQ